MIKLKMLGLEIFLILLLLTACSHLPPPPPPPIPVDGSLNIDSGLKVPCDEAATLESGKETDVVKWGLKLKGSLKDCSLRHKGIVDALRNIK